MTQVDSGVESAASSWDRTVAEVREQAEARLTEELRRAREELKLKDEQVLKLSRIRQEVESELEELTASLFQVQWNLGQTSKDRVRSFPLVYRQFSKHTQYTC